MSWLTHIVEFIHELRLLWFIYSQTLRETGGRASPKRYFVHIIGWFSCPTRATAKKVIKCGPIWIILSSQIRYVCCQYPIRSLILSGPYVPNFWDRGVWIRTLLPHFCVCWSSHLTMTCLFCIACRNSHLFNITPDHYTSNGILCMKPKIMFMQISSWQHILRIHVLTSCCTKGWTTKYFVISICRFCLDKFIILSV